MGVGIEVLGAVQKGRGPGLSFAGTLPVLALTSSLNAQAPPAKMTKKGQTRKGDWEGLLRGGFGEGPFGGGVAAVVWWREEVEPEVGDDGVGFCCCSAGRRAGAENCLGWREVENTEECSDGRLRRGTMEAMEDLVVRSFRWWLKMLR
jgi:hypothetical protein